MATELGLHFDAAVHGRCFSIVGFVQLLASTLRLPKRWLRLGKRACHASTCFSGFQILATSSGYDGGFVLCQNSNSLQDINNTIQVASYYAATIYDFK